MVTPRAGSGLRALVKCCDECKRCRGDYGGKFLADRHARSTPHLGVVRASEGSAILPARREWMRNHLLLTILVMCALSTRGVAAAQASEVAPAVTPPSENGPVDVAVGLYLIDISDINEANNTFQTELDIIAFWRDPRLAFDTAAEGSDRRIYVGDASERFRTQIWNAQGSAANAVGQMTLINQKIMISNQNGVPFVKILSFESFFLCTCLYHAFSSRYLLRIPLRILVVEFLSSPSSLLTKHL